MRPSIRSAGRPHIVAIRVGFKSSLCDGSMSKTQVFCGLLDWPNPFTESLANRAEMLAALVKINTDGAVYPAFLRWAWSCEKFPSTGRLLDRANTKSRLRGQLPNYAVRDIVAARRSKLRA